MNTAIAEQHPPLEAIEAETFPERERPVSPLRTWILAGILAAILLTFVARGAAGTLDSARDIAGLSPREAAAIAR